jgi:hypothetical protein
MNRDLDAEICEKIFKWRLIPVGPDANGGNATEILFTPDREPTQDDYNTLPRKGKPHKGINCPLYSGNLLIAIQLAKFVDLPCAIKHMPTNPEILAEKCLRYWEDKHGRK